MIKFTAPKVLVVAGAPERMHINKSNSLSKFKRRRGGIEKKKTFAVGTTAGRTRHSTNFVSPCGVKIFKCR